MESRKNSNDNPTKNCELEKQLLRTRKIEKHKTKKKKVDTYVYSVDRYVDSVDSKGDNVTRNRKLKTHLIGTRKMETEEREKH